MTGPTTARPAAKPTGAPKIMVQLITAVLFIAGFILLIILTEDR